MVKRGYSHSNPLPLLHCPGSPSALTHPPLIAVPQLWLQGVTPLHRAAEFGQTSALKALLSRGANANARDLKVRGPACMHCAFTSLYQAWIYRVTEHLIKQETPICLVGCVGQYSFTPGCMALPAYCNEDAHQSWG